MDIKSINQNNFKGYDARPLRGFYMSNNYTGLADEMYKIGQKEGFKIYSRIFQSPQSICGEYHGKAKTLMKPMGMWAQDLWTFTSKKLFTSVADFSLAIANFFNIEDSTEQKYHIPGGNLFMVDKDGKDILFLGEDALRNNNISDLKKLYDVENIMIFPQMDFHLDLFIRPLDKKRVLVADDELTLNVLQQGLQDLKKYVKENNLQLNPKVNFIVNKFQERIYNFKNNILQNELPKADKIVNILETAGFEPIRVPGRIYESTTINDIETFLMHDCNYMNANVLLNKDGDLVYITNKSNVDKELLLDSEELQGFDFRFEKEFVKTLSPYIKPDKIYFVDTKNNFISEKMLKNSQGGIHCICAEVPINIGKKKEG